jgi:DNA primase
MSEKFSIISKILGRYCKSGAEHLFACPYCKHHKHKFSVNIEKNVYKCWICDARGKNLYRLVRRFGTFSQQEKWKQLSGKVQDLSEFDLLFEERDQCEETRQILNLPAGFYSLTAKSLSKSGKLAKKYLTNRGLDDGDILRWKIGYCSAGEFKNRIIIPSFDMYGDLSYFIARTFAGDYRRYINPPVSRNIIFNELYVDFDEEVTIVEGVFDALKAKNAIPILGSTIRETSEIFKKIVKNDTPVLLALDPDAHKKSEIIKKLFLKYGIEIREIKYEDDRDVGDMTKEEFKKLSQKAQLIREEDTLVTAINAL